MQGFRNCKENKKISNQVLETILNCASALVEFQFSCKFNLTPTMNKKIIIELIWIKLFLLLNKLGKSKH